VGTVDGGKVLSGGGWTTPLRGIFEEGGAAITDAPGSGDGAGRVSHHPGPPTRGTLRAFGARAGRWPALKWGPQSFGDRPFLLGPGHRRGSQADPRRGLRQALARPVRFRGFPGGGGALRFQIGQGEEFFGGPLGVTARSDPRGGAGAFPFRFGAAPPKPRKTRGGGRFRTREGAARPGVGGPQGPRAGKTGRPPRPGPFVGTSGTGLGVRFGPRFAAGQNASAPGRRPWFSGGGGTMSFSGPGGRRWALFRTGGRQPKRPEAQRGGRGGERFNVPLRGGLSLGAAPPFFRGHGKPAALRTTWGLTKTWGPL